MWPRIVNILLPQVLFDYSVHLTKFRIILILNTSCNAMDLSPIKEKGLTKQRELVLTVIRSSKSHLTANEVFGEAKTISSNISFATVYNSLRYLKDAGHIAEIQCESIWPNYAPSRSRHLYQVRCVGWYRNGSSGQIGEKGRGDLKLQAWITWVYIEGSLPWLR